MFRLLLVLIVASLLMPFEGRTETLQEIGARLGKETAEAYGASPYIKGLAGDYFARFYHDPAEKPAQDETVIGEGWKIQHSKQADPLVARMAGHLQEFLKGSMGIDCPVEAVEADALSVPAAKVIRLRDKEGGDPAVPASFTVSANADSALIDGRDADGLRDGIVWLVNNIGLRKAPFIKQGSQVYKPKLTVRLGSNPLHGDYKDLVFMGYNAVMVGGGSLYGFSESDVIPELADRREPGSLESTRAAVEKAREYNLMPFAFVNIRQKFPKDHPVFQKHPELRGSLTWKADGEYVLCTEHPTVQKYLMESVETLFRGAPGLKGMIIIIGGEGFYHCFMRPFNVEKGRTDCPRCNQQDGETVVAHLCNYLAEAARKASPEALVVAWPYSAHIWSKDRNQTDLISKLGPGTAIFSEIEKDEYVEKPDGVQKLLWDYSIDLIGPGERAKQQVEACRKQGIPIFLKSEPELGFEAPRLPQIPCMDRWAARAKSLAECGADGAFVFPAFRPNYGTTANEANRPFWWDPSPSEDEALMAIASRVAGDQAAPHLRKAWKLVSDAIPLSPEIPPYYTGPYYLGPAHPMCVDEKAELPEVFYGYYLFMAEMDDAEGVKLRPTFDTDARGNQPVFGRMYAGMRDLLEQAVKETDLAAPLVAETNRVFWEAEVSPIRWFYHTVRTEANFYASCQLRDKWSKLTEKKPLSESDKKAAQDLIAEWKKVLEDELDNTEKALPVMKADARLDFRYGGDHTFPHGMDMMEAKLAILKSEINNLLPKWLAEAVQ